MATVTLRGISKSFGDFEVIKGIDLEIEDRGFVVFVGQRQRVAIGRAIVRNPKVFLFDEPLSNLDAGLRVQMRIEIARLHESLGNTMVYVTHDQTEAMTLADRIVVLRGGRVEQIGSPTELYDRPANTFVAGFIGSPKMNLLSGRVRAAEKGAIVVEHPAFRTGVLNVPHAASRPLQVGAPVTLGLRPENLELGSADPFLDLSADISENLGGTTQVHGRSPGGEMVTILAQGRPRLSPGDKLPVGLGSGRIYLFDESGKALK